MFSFKQIYYRSSIQYFQVNRLFDYQKNQPNKQKQKQNKTQILIISSVSWHNFSLLGWMQTYHRDSQVTEMFFPLQFCSVSQLNTLRIEVWSWLFTGKVDTFVKRCFSFNEAKQDQNKGIQTMPYIIKMFWTWILEHHRLVEIVGTFPGFD